MVFRSPRCSTKKKRSSPNRRRRLSNRLEKLEPRQLLASLAGEIWADTNGDGVRGDDESPAADIRVYIDANDDSSLNEGELFTSTDDLGQYVFNQVQAGTHVVRVDLRFGQTQTSPNAYFGTGTTIDDGGTGTAPTQLFEMTTSGLVTPIGQPTTNEIHGLVRTNSGKFVGVNFENDSLYTIDGGTGQETFLSTPGIQLVAGSGIRSCRRSDLWCRPKWHSDQCVPVVSHQPRHRCSYCCWCWPRRPSERERPSVRHDWQPYRWIRQFKRPVLSV